MGEPEDFKQKVSVTAGLIVWVGLMCGSMGFLYAQMLHNDKQSQQNAIDNRLYTEQEVGGLRSDWERDREQMLKRIEFLEKYHYEE